MAITNPIRGKVAKILNSRELVLNIGTNKGVKVGMKFDVMDTKGENIIDPDTKENIGSLERPKVRVKVIDVREQLSVVSTYRSKNINIGGIGTSFEPLVSLTAYLTPPKWVKKYETLKTNEATWEDLDESASFVKTGDSAVEVTEDEEDGQ